MRFVIYDDETLEPITVLNLRGFTERDIERHGRHYRVPVPLPLPLKISPKPPSEEALLEKIPVVELEFERFRRESPRHGRQDSWMCFTRATDLAMLLIPDWLPGQRPAVTALMEQNDRLTSWLMRAFI
jgi:hypothetical protein